MADAIKNDVSIEEQNKIIEAARDSVNSDRLETVNELAVAARERRDEEITENGGTPGEAFVDPDEEVKAEDKTANDDAEKAQIEADEAAALKAKEEEKEETRTLKVNGEDIEVPLSKILESGIRTMQKESSADQRLAEATQLLKEAKEQKLPSTDVTTTNNDSKPSSVDATKLAETMINGNVEEVADAIQQLVGAGRNDSENLATQVQGMDRSEVYGFVQDSLNLEKAMKKFKDSPENGGFSDLYNDPTLQKMVLDKEQELTESGDKRPYLERLTDAATEVRSWREGISTPTKAVVEDFDSLQSKKLNAESSIDGAGGRETPGRAKKPISREQKRKNSIHDMAKARGQQLD